MDEGLLEFRVNLAEFDLHVLAESFVEVRQRLVEQQDVGVDSE